jgi:hypothetical protein
MVEATPRTETALPNITSVRASFAHEWDAARQMPAT